MEDMKELLNELVDETYVKQGLDAITTREKLIKQLIREKKLPQNGFDDTTIEYFLNYLSMMDSNNFPNNIGVGEREGRIYSNLVSHRHYKLSHGIGRSGNISEVQPKAAGSSIISILTNHLVHDAIIQSGLTSMKQSLVLPMATGMTITLCLLALKQQNPNAKYVIWPRIDQKSCLKCIITAGLIPIPISNILNSDEISTNLNLLKETIENLEVTNILCVLSTTSCFAPRRPDLIDQISLLCQQFSLPHIINNAYGLQCPIITKLINRGVAIGRIDYIIQSTDKNFLVPVGGAIVSSPNPILIDNLSKLYPGRASASPIIDLFITLLSMGKNNFKNLHEERLRCLPLLINGLNSLANKYSQRVLICPHNTISIGFTLSSSQLTNVSFLGSQLFQRSISGCRVVTVIPSQPNILPKTTKFPGCEFINWGSHYDYYPSSYLTVACAVGIQEREIHLFLKKFDKVLHSAFTSPLVITSITPTITNTTTSTTVPAIPTTLGELNQNDEDKKVDGNDNIINHVEHFIESNEVIDTTPTITNTALATTTITTTPNEFNSNLSNIWFEMMQRKAKHM